MRLLDDLISRQAAIDIERNATVDTNPSHFEAHQKFTQFMNDAEISSFGRWQWSNGFNTALTAVGIDLKKLPSAQPEPCKDAVSREAVSEWLKQYGQDVLHGKYKFSLMYIWKNLMDLPPAQTERKVGKWTKDNACEFCEFQPWYEHDIHTLSFCPNCGADMRG